MSARVCGRIANELALMSQPSVVGQKNLCILTTNSNQISSCVCNRSTRNEDFRGGERVIFINGTVSAQMSGSAFENGPRLVSDVENMSHSRADLIRNALNELRIAQRFNGALLSVKRTKSPDTGDRKGVFCVPAGTCYSLDQIPSLKRLGLPSAKGAAINLEPGATP